MAPNAVLSAYALRSDGNITLTSAADTTAKIIIGSGGLITNGAISITPALVFGSIATPGEAIIRLCLVRSALEHAAQRLPVFAFARPGEHGGVERLVECAKRGERPERAPRIGGQRYAGQQGENAAAGWRRAGCVQSVPPCGTVRMLSGEHTSKALVRPSGAHDG